MMKANALKGIFFSIIVMFCLVITGCNRVKENSSQYEQAETIQNPNNAVTAIRILEHGGEDGRVIDWEVYRNDNKYILSYLDHNAFDEYNGETANPKIFEITEQEYSDIMSIDYAKYIREYDAKDWEDEDDAVNYRSTITYENEAEESTEANMTDATRKLHELLRKYDK